MTRDPWLTKSRYMAGLQCEKRLWLRAHSPEPTGEPVIGSWSSMGIEVGEAARLLFPGGVLILRELEIDAAVARTQALVGRGVPAIFEGAFRHEGKLVRADILERLPDGRWRLAEVKSSLDVQPEHIDDLAYQAFALRAVGLDLAAIELIHVNSEYLRGDGPIRWSEYFRHRDLTAQVLEALSSVPARVDRMRAVLHQNGAPTVERDAHCFSPSECEFWDRCTADRPEDWVFYLPNLRADQLSAMRAAGIERMSLVPPDFPLGERQRRHAACAAFGTEHVDASLGEQLQGLGPPAWYLDFETGSPAIPLYSGTRPYQRIPFEWSLHHDDGSGTLTHLEFLADARTDPRRAFAESLIAAVGADDPIIVYSGFESGVLAELASAFPELEPAFMRLQARLRDLLPIVRRCVVHPAFRGSYSIKAIAPALVPGFTYDDLGEIADGDGAAAAFYRLATNRFMLGETATSLSANLRAYCARDTLALARTHAALRARMVLP
jgi:uncharacterized protein DUF2779